MILRIYKLRSIPSIYGDLLTKVSRILNWLLSVLHRDTTTSANSRGSANLSQAVSLQIQCSSPILSGASAFVAGFFCSKNI